MIVVLHVCKAYNANSACYENLTRSYKHDLVSFLFSDLLSCHQFSEYSSLDTLFNIDRLFDFVCVKERWQKMIVCWLLITQYNN
jgi:hypothetical protein